MKFPDKNSDKNIPWWNFDRSVIFAENAVKVEISVKIWSQYSVFRPPARDPLMKIATKFYLIIFPLMYNFCGKKRLYLNALWQHSLCSPQFHFLLHLCVGRNLVKGHFRLKMNEGIASWNDFPGTLYTRGHNAWNTVKWIYSTKFNVNLIHEINLKFMKWFRRQNMLRNVCDLTGFRSPYALKTTAHKKLMGKLTKREVLQVSRLVRMHCAR